MGISPHEIVECERMFNFIVKTDNANRRAFAAGEYEVYFTNDGCFYLYKVAANPVLTRGYDITWLGGKMVKRVSAVDVLNDPNAFTRLKEFIIFNMNSVINYDH